MGDVDRVKQSIDAISLISSYVPLKRAGARYVGRCPFHEEKTPSFSVREDGLFYCFGCGVGGDVIRFLELKEGVEFPEALRRAAEFAGVALEDEKRKGPRRDPAEFEAGMEMLAAAQAYFHRMLLKSSKAEAARAYLIERGIPESHWDRFRLGYAWGGDNDWSALVRKKGWSTTIAAKLGLLTAAGDHDRLRNRLIFPIRDVKGRTVGFGARRLDPEDRAKYLNSPDSMWFHKGNVLFGHDLAQPSWREHRRAVLCEGYTDVIRFDIAAVPGAVAPLGTAITERQAARIAARVRSVVLAFDNDEAGTRAALNAWALLHARGVEVRMLDLPPDADPDSFAQAEGDAALRQRVEEAPLFWPQHLARQFHADADTETKRRAIDQILEKLAALGNPVDAELLIEELSEAAGVGAEALKARLADLRRNVPQQRTRRADPEDTSGRPRGAEAALVRYLLHHSAERFEIQHRLEEVADHLHPWLNQVLAGAQSDEPGYRQWLAEMSFGDAPELALDELVTQVRDLARRRLRKRRAEELEQEVEQLRQAGRTDEARQVIEALHALHTENGVR